MIGNIGRFINVRIELCLLPVLYKSYCVEALKIFFSNIQHSCEPNIFVQNVFVDTHDLRLPWVGFFAHSYIHAGTELTWDYGYEVGSVPGKELFCHCGTKTCRGRLL